MLTVCFISLKLYLLLPNLCFIIAPDILDFGDVSNLKIYDKVCIFSANTKVGHKPYFGRKISQKRI